MPEGRGTPAERESPYIGTYELKYAYIHGSTLLNSSVCISNACTYLVVVKNGALQQRNEDCLVVFICSITIACSRGGGGGGGGGWVG